MDDFSSDEVPLERLEADLAGLAASIASATCSWLLTLAVYDERGGWESWGCKSCAHWLTWKCGMALRTAREHVQVARLLEHLPIVADAFANGRLSYCKVRAICRVANEDNEAELVDLAIAMTGAQLERTVAGLASAARNEGEEAFDAIAARRVSFANNGDGTHTMTLVVPTADAALVREAINERTDAIIVDASADEQTRMEAIEHRGGLAAVRADAAVELLTTAGDAGDTSEPRPFDVTVVVDNDVLDNDVLDHDVLDDHETVVDETETGAAAPDSSERTCRIGAHRIAPTTARRLCCDGIVSTAVGHNTASGTALIDIGRRSRVVPRRLRRALEQRDNNCCQFPGCDAARRLHAHHIIWWRYDGETNFDNLVLVCHFHHRVVHEGKWTVRSTTRGIEFVDPTGEVASGHQLPVSPFGLKEPDDHHLGSNWAGEGLDYRWITAAALNNEKVNRERRQPQPV